jgi:hypothetical protein
MAGYASVAWPERVSETARPRESGDQALAERDRRERVPSREVERPVRRRNYSSGGLGDVRWTFDGTADATLLEPRASALRGWRSGLLGRFHVW